MASPDQSLQARAAVRGQPRRQDLVQALTGHVRTDLEADVTRDSLAHNRVLPTEISHRRPTPMTDTADGSPLTPGQVRWLKIAVVVMGIMIIVGIAILIGRILYLASTGPRQAMPVRAPIHTDSTVGIPPGASIRSVALSNDRLAIHYEGPRGAGIVVVDLASGMRIGRVEVVPEPPR